MFKWEGKSAAAVFLHDSTVVQPFDIWPSCFNTESSTEMARLGGGIDGRTETLTGQGGTQTPSVLTGGSD